MEEGICVKRRAKSEKNDKRDPSLIREMKAHRWVVEVISANVTDFNETSIVVVQCPLSMNVA